jgi:hypothetical protein
MKPSKVTSSITPPLETKDASIYLRNQLKSNYVIIPEISPRIPIERYFIMATRLYDQAYTYYKQKDKQLINAYIDYQKFLLLILDRIPKHPQYKTIIVGKLPASLSPATMKEEKRLIEYKQWIEKMKLPSITILEELVKMMDLLEYQKQKVLSEEALEATFDEIEAKEEVEEEEAETNGQDKTDATAPVEKRSTLSITEIRNSLVYLSTPSYSLPVPSSSAVPPREEDPIFSKEMASQEPLSITDEDFQLLSLGAPSTSVTSNTATTLAVPPPPPVSVTATMPSAPPAPPIQSLIGGGGGGGGGSGDNKISNRSLKKLDILKNPYDLEESLDSSVEPVDRGLKKDSVKYQLLSSSASSSAAATNQLQQVPVQPPPLPALTILKSLSMEDILICKHLLATSTSR